MSVKLLEYYRYCITHNKKKTNNIKYRLIEAWPNALKCAQLKKHLIREFDSIEKIDPSSVVKIKSSYKF